MEQIIRRAEPWFSLPPAIAAMLTGTTGAVAPHLLPASVQEGVLPTVALAWCVLLAAGGVLVIAARIAKKPRSESTGLFAIALSVAFYSIVLGATLFPSAVIPATIVFSYAVTIGTRAGLIVRMENRLRDLKELARLESNGEL